MITKGVCWDDRESIKYVLSNLPQTLTTLTVFTSRLGFLSRPRLSVTHIPQHRGYGDFVQSVVQDHLRSEDSILPDNLSRLTSYLPSNLSSCSFAHYLPRLRTPLTQLRVLYIAR